MLDLCPFGAAFRLVFLLPQGGADAGEEKIVIERFFEEIRSPDLHRFDCKRDIAVTGDNDDRNADLKFFQAP